jgi:molybdopterin-binding protein
LITSGVLAECTGAAQHTHLSQEIPLKISARNCIEGKVVAIHDGPVSTVETPAGERIVSSITTTSAKALGLKGAKAYAVIKASNVMLAVD